MVEILVQVIDCDCVDLLFVGSRKLRNLGSDLGEAYKGFRKAMHSDTSQESASSNPSPSPLETKDK